MCYCESIKKPKIFPPLHSIVADIYFNNHFVCPNFLTVYYVALFLLFIGL